MKRRGYEDRKDQEGERSAKRQRVVYVADSLLEKINNMQSVEKHHSQERQQPTVSMQQQQQQQQQLHPELLKLIETLEAKVNELDMLRMEQEQQILLLRDENFEHQEKLRVNNDHLLQIQSDLEQRENLIKSTEQNMIQREEERKRLHNTIMELKGNIRVFCRVRPSKKASVITTDEVKSLVMLPQKKSSSKLQKSEDSIFKFNHVFGAKRGQQDVFSHIAQFVQSGLDGYNVSMFAYGQTGSGKTHTMEGNDFDQGIIPRSVHQIFETIEQRAQMVEYRNWTYRVNVAYLEIYQNEIRDLLNAKSKAFKKDDIKHQDEISAIAGLTTKTVGSVPEVLQLIKLASKNRSVAKTNMNEKSSRSHSVFTMSIVGTNSESNQASHGVLNLIDLAGSERIQKSGVSGTRLTETTAINGSLTCLRNVIRALVNKQPHAPFRDSILTYWLKPYLQGQGKCLMFVNIGPEEEHLEETKSSLQFASVARKCERRAV
jgi:kinesin family protein C1